MDDQRPRRSRLRFLRSPILLGITLLLALGVVVALLAVDGLLYSLQATLRGSADYDALEERPVASTAVVAAAAAPAYWTEYRGPSGDGLHDEGDLDLEWEDGGPPRLWRAEVGPAYSSLVVAGGLVITMEQRREEEAVVAFALETGELVWSHAWPGRFHEALSKEGPRATPLVAGDVVIALGASGKLVALALADGGLRWQRDLLADPESGNMTYGLCASPRRSGELVIVQGPASILALDVASGEPRWEALSEKMAYATPQLGEVLGRATVLVSTAERVVGLDAGTGAELWSFPWSVASDLACTQPIVVAPDKVLVSAGYGAGSQLVQLAEGDAGITVEVAWRGARFKTRWNEPLLVGRYAYGLDEGVLECIDPLTGKRAWKGGRYGYGQLLAHGERLLVVDEDGDVHLVEASPEGHVELASFEGLEGEMNLNVPALAHGRLLLRNERELLCFDLRPPQGPSAAPDPHAEH